MLQDVPIRAKLLAILVLPALGMVILASLRIAGDLHDEAAAKRGGLAVALAVDATTLAHELGGERELSAVWQSRARQQPDDRAALLAARARVDRAISRFRASATRFDGSGHDPTLPRLLQASLAGLGRLPARRDGVDDGGRTPATVRDTITAYGVTTGPLLDLAARLPVAAAADGSGGGSGGGPSADRDPGPNFGDPSPDPGADPGTGSRLADPGADPGTGSNFGGGLDRGLSALASLARAEEAASMQRALGAAVTLSGGFQGGDQQLLAAAMGARQHELAHFLAVASAAQRDRYQRAVGAPRVEQADELEGLLLGIGRDPSRQVSPDDWLPASGERVDALRSVVTVLGAQAVAANRAAADSAANHLVANAMVLLVAVLASLALASFVARSIIRPLLLLEQAARDVAEHQLPGVVERLHTREPIDLDAQARPIDVGVAGEIGRVAAAFSAVQRVAVSVATEQAAARQSVTETFVNMARRSQSLVDRQLALIDELERYEADAVRLKQFFKLDHLATRMRRNAESLIVLSGSQPGHRWNEPVPLAALLRAAVSETEDYLRVRVLPITPIAVAGHAGVDVAHLLAELIENAASFSPSHTAVLVAGEPVPSGYLIEVEDRGIGMSDAELLASNQRLSDPPPADFNVSRMLGFYVVGRLAQRHDIKVQLRHSPYGGVTALVLLPAVLLSRQPSEGGPEPTVHGWGRGLRGALPRRTPMAGADPASGPDEGGLPLLAPAGPGDRSREHVRGMLSRFQAATRRGREAGRTDEPGPTGEPDPTAEPDPTRER
jgi:signal transduction histidine kinase